MNGSLAKQGYVNKRTGFFRLSRLDSFTDPLPVTGPYITPLSAYTAIRSPAGLRTRLQMMDELKASWTTAIDVKERIEYTRNGDDVDIRVKFR